jgi:hypothetical protein
MRVALRAVLGLSIAAVLAVPMAAATGRTIDDPTPLCGG